MKRTICLLCAAAMCLLSCAARAENDGDCVYALTDRAGNLLAQRGGRIYVGDGYIAGDDAEYRVVAVNDETCTAIAELVESDAQAFAAAQGETKKQDTDGKKRICMYSTHSDESYVPGDGDSSKWVNAGIYDVGDSLKAALVKQGIDVEYSHDTFLPHDADAYTRSRRTAEELLKQAPDALLDIHRDAVPAEQYETEVDGEDISKVRLFVGRSNPNAAENKAFARQIKAAADEMYPGLVKDIFIGKGNYNQELYPKSLLLEFGTHEIEKDKAIEATSYMAKVLDSVLYGEGAKAEGGKRTGAKPVAKGVGWTLGLALLAAAAYAFLATGSVSGAWDKMKRRASEITGGVLGKTH